MYSTNIFCAALLTHFSAQAQKRTAIFESHELRAGALAWNGDLLCSGSRDRVIIQRDIRTPPHQFKKLTGHKQEVSFYYYFIKFAVFTSNNFIFFLSPFILRLSTKIARKNIRKILFKSIAYFGICKVKITFNHISKVDV